MLFIVLIPPSFLLFPLTLYCNTIFHCNTIFPTPSADYGSAEKKSSSPKEATLVAYSRWITSFHRPEIDLASTSLV